MSAESSSNSNNDKLAESICICTQECSIWEYFIWPVLITILVAQSDQTATVCKIQTCTVANVINLYMSKFQRVFNRKLKILQSCYCLQNLTAKLFSHYTQKHKKQTGRGVCGGTISGVGNCIQWTVTFWWLNWCNLQQMMCSCSVPLFVLRTWSSCDW